MKDIIEGEREHDRRLKTGRVIVHVRDGKLLLSERDRTPNNNNNNKRKKRNNVYLRRMPNKGYNSKYTYIHIYFLFVLLPFIPITKCNSFLTYVLLRHHLLGIMSCTIWYWCDISRFSLLLVGLVCFGRRNLMGLS